MVVSVFDLFKIGIGPSSSHTVGPMRAARSFVQMLDERELLTQTQTVLVELFGSLSATGRGHGTDKAVVLGLMGHTPEEVPIADVPALLNHVRSEQRISLLGKHEITFQERQHLRFMPKSLPFHPNGLRLTAFKTAQSELAKRVYFSVGGGFVVDEQAASGADPLKVQEREVPYPFKTAAELLAHCAAHSVTISQIMLENERTERSEAEIRSGLLRIWNVMRDCVERGCNAEGTLPGGLHVVRRAPALFRQLRARAGTARESLDPLAALDWVNLFALSVNEENAAGGRIVTAPTNGAAGIIPAVLHYYVRFVPGASEDGIARFLLTAAAIGVLYKENASISGAEVGCQGEVGSACSMAAGALAEVLGGTPQQVENAAEIGMEHNLGLTCDPVGGLVQVPCIERNAMASIKAINAARLALQGDGQHFVSLDKVIKTMRETGADMKDKYKETARGGLALNVIQLPGGVSVGLPEC